VCVQMTEIQATLLILILTPVSRGTAFPAEARP
jgi:hypothetical protein